MTPRYIDANQIVYWIRHISRVVIAVQKCWRKKNETLD